MEKFWDILPRSVGGTSDPCPVKAVLPACLVERIALSKKDEPGWVFLYPSKSTFKTVFYFWSFSAKQVWRNFPQRQNHTYGVVFCLVERIGFEPTTPALSRRCSKPTELTLQYFNLVRQVNQLSQFPN